MKGSSVIVQVPASTSNCGPGFDVLGIALTLYNFVRVTRKDSGGIRPEEPGASCEVATGVVKEVAAVFEAETGKAASDFTFDIWGEVPRTRGLGSSATVVTGILAGLNALHGEPLRRHEMVRIATRLDGAPDNSAASIMGGFCVSRANPETGEYVNTIRFEVPAELAMVVVSPDVEVPTAIAREALPDELPFNDAVRSLNSLAYLVSIFASGNYSELEGAVTDYIHQPYRERLFPYVQEIISAGCGAGAYTGWLSGSGSSTLCVAPAKKALKVGQAMTEVLQANNVQSRLFLLKTDNEGLKVETE